jgi:hypothetical protein
VELILKDGKRRFWCTKCQQLHKTQKCTVELEASAEENRHYREFWAEMDAIRERRKAERVG